MLSAGLVVQLILTDILLLECSIQHLVPRLETITMVIKDNSVGQEMMNIVSEMGLKQSTDD